MKPLPILNTPTLHERIPLPSGRGITVPGLTGKILTIAANPTDAETMKAQHGDMFLNPNSGHCVEYGTEGFEPAKPDVMKALSRWMAATLPGLHSQINWDDQPNWRQS